MKVYFTTAFLFLCCLIKSQTDTLDDLNLKVYKSIADANSVNKDSVYALDLRSCALKSFPKEICKFKNLKILKLGSYYSDEVYELLSENEKRELDEIKKKNPAFYVPPIYKQNNLKCIPKEVKNLTKLSYFEFDGSIIRIKDIHYLKKKWPATIFEPSIETIEMMKNN